MKLTLQDRALAYATVWHKNQYRKRSGLPYIVHPISVVKIISQEFGNLPVSGNMVCAGYLHDVIEDCGVTKEILIDEFNLNVADLVQELTAPKFTENRDKDAYILDSMSGMSTEAFIIKIADRLDNVRDAATYGWANYMIRTDRIMKKLVKRRKIPDYLEPLFSEIRRVIQYNVGGTHE
jgi:(p)ppGpp synthase/HD superfamily hydrolase